MAKIDPRKQLFCEGKASGRSNKDLAEELGITEKTASVWNRDPAVQAKIHDLQVENWVQSQALLISLQREAIVILAKLLESQDERIRLKSACCLLDLCASFPSYI